MLCEHAALQEGFGWHSCHVGTVREGHNPGVREVWDQTGALVDGRKEMEEGRGPVWLW